MMAFQSIPPRVSSSPPPLDDLSSNLTCGDDDEFGGFCTSRSSFDITGLSDKLPPTPESSPSKFPNVITSEESNVSSAVSIKDVSKIEEDTVQQLSTPQLESYRKDECEINQDLDSSPFSDSNRLIKSKELKVENDGFGDFSSAQQNEEFGDFSHSQPNDEFGEFSFSQPNDEYGEFSCSNLNESEINLDIVNNSHERKVNSDQSINKETISNIDNSINSPTNSVHNYTVIATPPPLDHVTESGIIEDEFSRISPNPLFSTVVDDDFGDFTVYSFKNIDSTSQSLSNNVLITENFKSGEIYNAIVSHFVDSETNTVDDVNRTIDQKSANLEKECSGCDDYVKNVSEEYTERTVHPLTSSSALQSDVLQGDSNSPQNSNAIICKAKIFSDMYPRSGEIPSLQLDIFPSQETETSTCSVNVHENKETEHNTSNTETNYEGTCNFDSSNTRDQSDSEFGDFGQAVYEDDDLDFADIQEKVKSGIFCNEEAVDDMDEFGDFYEGCNKIVPPNDEDNFGDFAKAIDNPLSEKPVHNDEFGDFADADSYDDFGSYSSPKDSVVMEIGFNASLKSEAEKNDQFNDFSGQSISENISFSGSKDVLTSTSCYDSPLVKKLENLMMKWIPKDKNPNTCMDNQNIPTLCHCIEDDAFVWRQLQNLDASAALTLSWTRMRAHTLYLSSVNVDARNILFGQKWSSSVPLFAQALSFSPLTPAKPTEYSSSSIENGNRRVITPPILTSSISPKFSSRYHRETGHRGIDDKIPFIKPIGEDDQEEQIPPAKFDWNLSGLINPLEGSGLEQEFLNEAMEAPGSSSINISTAMPLPEPSPLIQQILDGNNLTKAHSSTTTTNLQSLSVEIREVVENLPNLQFMRSPVLMFPIRGGGSSGGE